MDRDTSAFMPTPVTVQAEPASLLRRLAAIVYDLLLLSAVVFVAAQPLPLLPDVVHKVWWGKLGKQLYVLTLGLLYFGWFWVHGGQTLGMRAWRLRLIGADGAAVTWPRAAVRYLTALLSWAAAGLGFMWSLVDGEKRTWHDLISGTRLVLIPRVSSHHAAQQHQTGAQEQQGRQ
jgi:uncharacterized RDD family membrane protein YckC